MIPTDELNKRGPAKNAYTSGPRVYPHYVMEGTQACPNPWDIEIARLASLNKELVEALEKAADTFRDTKVVCEMIGRMTLAEGMRIAEEGTRAVLAKVKS